MKKVINLSTYFFSLGFFIGFFQQANPDISACLGVFGLSLYTTERDLREVFSKYGPLSDVNIVYHQQSRRSRGYAFVYFENSEDAKEVSMSRDLDSNCSSGGDADGDCGHLG